MKKYVWITIIYYLFIPFIVSASEIRFPPKPASGLIVDNVQLLTPEMRQQIEKTQLEIFREFKTPIVVVILSSIDQYAPSSTVEYYAKSLFNEWGIASVGDNYGILLLVFMQDHKIRIQLARAWPRYSTFKTDYIIWNITSKFKEKLYSEGLKEGVVDIGSMIKNRNGAWYRDEIILICGIGAATLFILLFIIFKILRTKNIFLRIALILVIMVIALPLMIYFSKQVLMGLFVLGFVIIRSLFPGRYDDYHYSWRRDNSSSRSSSSSGSSGSW